MKKRAIAIWRKDLIHLNKTRDNHFRYFGKYFDLILLSPSNRTIGDHISKEGTKVITVNVSNSPFWLFEFYWKCFIIIKRKKDFDLFISPIGEEPIGWLFSRLLFNKRPKLVFDLWDIPGSNIVKHPLYKPKKYLITLYHFILNRIIKKADIVISGVLPAGLEGFKIDPEKIICTHNGIQPDAFINSSNKQPTDSRWEWAEQDLIKIIYVGYIHKTRGSNLLIEYAKHIKRNKLSACIMMVGPSDQTTNAQLLADINLYKINNIIKIISEVHSSEIQSIISSADIGICALDNIDKFRWSYPVKIYEYLRCEIAIVATDLPGISAIITNHFNGLLFTANNTKEFNKKVDDLVNNKKLRYKIKKNALATVKNFEYNGLIGNVAKSIIKHLDE